MFVSYSISVFGFQFEPNEVLHKLKTSLVVEDMSSNHLSPRGMYVEMNFLGLIHKNKFSKEYYDEKYEQEFVDFFKNNYELLKEYGAEEFVLMMDIFYCDQCNFEIFDKGKLKELAKGDVSLPISVYYLEPDDYYSDLYYQLNPDLKYGERL